VMLKQLEMLFGRKMWNSTIIEISKFSYKQEYIDLRELQCELTPENCRDEAFFYDEINRELEEKFHIEMKLPIVFIDSYSQLPDFLDDDTQQSHWKEETTKLLDFSNKSPEFIFKTVDEVLEENYEMRKEIEWLNEVITNNISEFNARLDKETLERQENDSALTEDLAAEVTRVDEVIDTIQEFPIGTIIAWVPAPARESSTDPIEIPVGWKRCDGSSIIDGPWKGKSTPNLNGDNYFLRGGVDADYLEVQDHAIAGHTHTYAHQYIYDSNGDDHMDVGWGETWNYKSASETSTTDACDKGKEKKEECDNETRPKNMKVVWLMKVA